MFGVDQTFDNTLRANSCLPFALRRFRSCRQAYEMILNNRDDKTKKDKYKEYKTESCPCENSDSAICCVAEMAAASCY